MNPEQQTKLINGYADFFVRGMRAPILRTPLEYGMKYEDVFFPSLDGTVLEGWFIPADSDKLIICNHPMPMNRYGFPGHLEAYQNFGGFEVNFLPDYKHLHEAGYNILAYDLRNHGRSASGSGGISGIGLLEYRDVIGSIKYVKSRDDLSKMKLGLFSRCLGANSTIVAMAKHPGYFTEVKAMVSLQPVSAGALARRILENSGIEIEKGLAQFDQRIFATTGFHLEELSPLEYAEGVKVPTLVAQVKDDSSIAPETVLNIFKRMSATEKELFWIEGTTRRFDGYNYFGSNPTKMLEWFSKYLS